MRRLSICSVVCVLTLTSVVLSQAPQPTGNLAPAGDVVIGSGSFSPIVSDLERSLKFYSDLVGTPPPQTVPAWSTDPALLNFLGSPTSQIRFGTVRIPGSALTVEIVEFKDIDRRPVRPRVSDPGAVRLILIVRDIDSMLSRLAGQGVPVVTTGKTPVAFRTRDAGRAVLIQDPDGFFIELFQPEVLPASSAPATSNVVGARFGLTINDTDQTMKFYRDLLGFQPQIGEDFSGEKALTMENEALKRDVSFTAVESRTVKGGGGTPVQYWLLRPPNFDASRKYPVVFLIHGGPQGAWEDAWSTAVAFRSFGISSTR